MGKFYAVKKGREVGIFNTWKECQEKINGFSGAQYKSFKTLLEAKEYMELNKEKEIYSEEECVIAYVDGSYEHTIKRYGSGILLIKDNDTILEKSIGGSEEDMISMRNVAGEVKAAEYAMIYCIEKGCKNLLLYYDYLGIENWCTGLWKANKVGTKRYKDIYNECVSKGLNIRFLKVKAHSGDIYNDKADMLAKKGLEI